MSTKASDFQSIKLKIASPEEILSWSHGEVTKPETINYRTQRAEKDGLFCERIFGPEKDWECYCGKYRRIRYKGIVCDKCGVEVTKSSVRRERMGHIKLAVPVTHIWFLRGVPSKIGLLLDIAVQDLEKVVYFAGYIITKVNESEKEKVIGEIEREYKTKLKSSKPRRKEGLSLRGRAQDKQEETKVKQNLKTQRDTAIRQVRDIHRLQILSELDYRDLSLKYSQVFEAGMGAETLKNICVEINLGDLAKQLEERSQKGDSLSRKKSLKRLRLVEGMIRAKIRPEWMFLTILPVLPPDLRPMVQLDGGRYATSDVNDLYRRVINRNNRLKRLLELKAPEVISRNERRMLQEAVDALIDNTSRRGQVMVAASTGQKRALKSLADMLKGKQGRFRQNLLGKRVDYSGRSVIVVGPELKLNECGLPKYMALELFKPFVINKLVERGLAHNIRGAGRLIEEGIDDVWSILEEVTKDRYVLLNRAPTLHRLSIQAFRPVLVEGNAIRIHPVVCQAFNADFDGDQMAVHLPLSKKAQTEAKEIMLSVHNLLKPATGYPVAVPSQDMVLGCYWMTIIKDGLLGQGKIFGNAEEALLAKHFGYVDLRAKIKVRLNKKEIIGDSPGFSRTQELKKVSKKSKKDSQALASRSNNLAETSVGRLIFNEALPENMPYINKVMDKRELRKLVAELIDDYGFEEVGKILDKIKRMGFKYATDSGISWGMDDLRTPKEKEIWLKEAAKEVAVIEEQHKKGFLTNEEKKSRVINAWFGVTEKLAKRSREILDPDNPIKAIFSSGSRGNWEQMRQMAAIKGLVVNPAGETIELPVMSSYKEGFNVLEYFIATHGGRKGTADTALKTAQAGYLTRRLIDVVQDIVVQEEDCGTKQGIYVYQSDEEELGYSLGSRVVGRVALETITLPNKKILVKANQLIDKKIAQKIDEAKIEKIYIRSVITCRLNKGVCQKCYGYDLGRNELVRLGEAVGIITAQAIGEPGTQLTLRTFHTGGVAGAKGQDITMGLPRVEEIFEARLPKGRSIISEHNGRVKEIIERGKQIIVSLEAEVAAGGKKNKGKIRKKKKVIEYNLPKGIAVWVEKGDLISQGQQLNEGHIDLKELYKVAGQEAVQRYVLKEVQRVYTSAGEGVNDKHIEMIIRQMFSRVSIKDSGSTSFLPGQIIEMPFFNRENEQVAKKGGKKAIGQQMLLGITKVALSTESWLSAASFQETARVLIDAAILGKKDHLLGLKENVIIGKLIPAGTAYRK